MSQMTKSLIVFIYIEYTEKFLDFSSCYMYEHEFVSVWVCDISISFSRISRYWRLLLLINIFKKMSYRWWIEEFDYIKVFVLHVQRIADDVGSVASIRIVIGWGVDL